jgi:hypothetical protein
MPARGPRLRCAMKHIGGVPGAGPSMFVAPIALVVANPG